MNLLTEKETGGSHRICAGTLCQEQLRMMKPKSDTPWGWLAVWEVEFCWYCTAGAAK